MSNPIITEIRGRTLIVRFARPEIRNPLSEIVLSELERILDRVSSESIVFTGTGNIFASGADLREIASVDADTAPAFARRGQGLMNRIAALPVKTTAAINGYCFGGALDLALACRERIASPTATFCHPGTGLGIITGWGGTQRLPRLIGEANALEMLFTATPISAHEALRIGLIGRIASNPLAACNQR